MEQEKAQLKGFFVGKKRRELEENITILENNLNALIVPQAPGERPVQEEPPAQESFLADLSADSKVEKLEVEASVFPDVRARLKQIDDIKLASVGDKVYLGTYPYTASGEIQKLQWRVLEKREGSVLLITEEGIDAKIYHAESGNITWQDCTLRKWLNEEFINTTFIDVEQTFIQNTRVDNSKLQGYSGYDTDGGNDTLDKIFFLSYKETFEDYFTSNEERVCVPTAYAMQKNSYKMVEKRQWEWWLRSPGYKQWDAVIVQKDGSKSFDRARLHSNLIRPALWINPESDIF